MSRKRNGSSQGVADTSRAQSELLRSFYLTMMSVIQGVAFAYLLYVALGGSQKGTPAEATEWMAVGLSLLTVAVVTFEYTSVAEVYRWPLTFLDVLVPILLGAAEVVPMSLWTERKRWWLANAALMGVSLLAYVNSYRKNKQSQYGNQTKSVEMFRTTRRWLLVGGTGLVLGAAFCLVMWLTWPDQWSSLREWGSMATLFLFCILMAVKEDRFLGEFRRLMSPDEVRS